MGEEDERKREGGGREMEMKAKNINAQQVKDTEKI